MVPDGTGPRGQLFRCADGCPPAHGVTEVRSIDKARAARLVQAQLLGDDRMFIAALAEAGRDEGGAGTLQVVRALSRDLALVLVDRLGHEAAVAMTSEAILALVRDDTP